MKDTNYIFPLFDFNSLVDINLSIVHMIRNEFYSSKYFINLDDEYFIKCLLTTMKDRNVIKAIIQPKYEDRCEYSLYDDFLNDEHLPLYFVEFPLSKVFRIALETGYTPAAILCTNDVQKKYCAKHFPSGNIEYLEPGTKININKKYDCYYTSDIMDVVNKIDNPKKIQFRILRFDYNLEDKDGIELVNLEIAKPYLGSNTFCLVDPYTDIIIPDKEKEESLNGNAF